MKLLHLNFIPRSADVALLVLRVWYGLSLFALHGWGKLTSFSAMAEKFPDPLGIGHTPSLLLATFAEGICSLLLVLGLFTRVAALAALVNLGVAFWLVHGHKLSGAGSGELAMIYLGAFVALFVGGGGKFSVDAQIGAKN
jgi:putative oxidoreductase